MALNGTGCLEHVFTQIIHHLLPREEGLTDGSLHESRYVALLSTVQEQACLCRHMELADRRAV